jgi:hypothetical protein
MRFPSMTIRLAGALCLLSPAPALRGQVAELPTQIAPVSEAGRFTLFPTLSNIKGAPFSASFQSEGKQVLADGTTITNTRTGKIARDSEGRTYMEITTLRGPGVNPQSFTSVNINDPVSGAHIVLMPDGHTARRFERTPPSSDATRTPSVPSAGGLTSNGAPSQPAGTMMAKSSLPPIQKEDLGVDSLEGIPARHYCETQTIPPGQVGNDRDMAITSEFWYSKELRLNLKATRKDPRFGEESLIISNVERSEPPASLFEIPADYKVVDEHPGSISSGAVEAKP